MVTTTHPKGDVSADLIISLTCLKETDLHLVRLSTQSNN